MLNQCKLLSKINFRNVSENLFKKDNINWRLIDYSPYPVYCLRCNQYTFQCSLLDLYKKEKNDNNNKK